MRVPWTKALIGLAVVLALAAAYWLLSGSTLLAGLLADGALQGRIVALGPWGPVAVVGLMTTAIVLSPIPSAPIALAAGAAYGHLWGTIYVLVGAELGALIAFGLARIFGHDLVRSWFGRRLDIGLLGSQRVLMATVFVTRLLPFLSFDMVSYAAGLTALSAWRFAVATLAGILPASFLLAHFGGELATADSRRIVVAVLALGLLTGLPFVLKALWTRHKKRKAPRPSPGAGPSDPVPDADGRQD